MNPTELALHSLGWTKRASLLGDAVGQFSNAATLNSPASGTPIDRTMSHVTQATSAADAGAYAMSKLPGVFKAINFAAPAAASYLGTAAKAAPYAMLGSLSAETGKILANPSAELHGFDNDMQNRSLLGRMMGGAGQPMHAIGNAGRQLFNISARPVLESFRPSPLHGSPTSTVMRSFQAPQ